MVANTTFDQAWVGNPPEPYTIPEYFHGVIWRRVVAYCIFDALVVVLLWAVAAVAFTGITIVSFGTLHSVWLLYAFIPLAYHTLTIGGPMSATLGMRFMGVEVRNWTGERPSLAQALVLTALFYVSTAMTAFLVLLFVFFNRRHCTLHDLIAGTLVVRRFPAPAVLNAE
jgi:uncharacterized RDD family membrane protein YckC